MRALRRTSARVLSAALLATLPACARLVPALPMLDPGAPAAAVPLSAEAFERRLAAARSFLDGVETYACRLEARERIGSVLVGKELELRLGQRPLRMAFTLLAPPAEAGQRVWWDETWNDGELWVVPPGLAGALLGHLSLEPTGRLALRGQRHPVLDIGLLRLVEQVEQRWSEARAQGGTAWALATTLAGRPATLIGFQVVHEDGDGARIEQRCRVGFDESWGVAVYCALEACAATGDELLEEYLYRDLEWDPGFEERDFRP